MSIYTFSNSAMVSKVNNKALSTDESFELSWTVKNLYTLYNQLLSHVRM